MADEIAEYAEKLLEQMKAHARRSRSFAIREEMTERLKKFEIAFGSAKTAKKRFEAAVDLDYDLPRNVPVVWRARINELKGWLKLEAGTS